MAKLQIMLLTSFAFLFVDPTSVLGLDQTIGRLSSNPGGSKGVKASVQRMATLAFGCSGVDAGDVNITCSHAKLEKRFGEGLDCTSKVPVKTQVFFVNCPPGFALVEDYQIINCKFPGRWDNEMFTCDEVSTVATTTAKLTTKAVSLNATTKPKTKPANTTTKPSNITTTKAANTTKASSVSTTLSLSATTPVANTTVASSTVVTPISTLSTTVAVATTSSTAATVAANPLSTSSSVAATTSTVLASTPTSITTTATTTVPTSITLDTTAVTTTTTTAPTTTQLTTTTAPTVTTPSVATTTDNSTTSTTPATPTTTNTASSSSSNRKRNGYVHEFEDSNYKRHDLSLNWDDSEAKCVSEGAHLVIIEKVEELNFILSKTGGLEIFLGMESKLVPKVFVPVNGLPLPDFLPWCLTQPDNNLGNEKCAAAFNKAIGNTYCYYDVQCDRTPYVSICERNNSQSLVTTPTI